MCYTASVAINSKLEIQAYKKLAEVLVEIDEVRSLFEQARSPLPDILMRLMRSSSNGTGSHATQETGSQFKPPVPSDVDPDWVWIEAKQATAGTLALAIARDSEQPLTTREIYERVSQYMDVALGTIANAGTRAAEVGTIDRDEDGRWIVVHKDKLATIRDGILWGPPAALQSQELATHRRNAIIHLLGENPSGLQQSQILTLLRKFGLPEGVPFNKSLVKADVEAMEGRQIRRRGNSKKWELLT
jgi:hypothetical protein